MLSSPIGTIADWYYYRLDLLPRTGRRVRPVAGAGAGAAPSAPRGATPRAKDHNWTANDYKRLQIGLQMTIQDYKLTTIGLPKTMQDCSWTVSDYKGLQLDYK